MSLPGNVAPAGDGGPLPVTSAPTGPGDTAFPARDDQRDVILRTVGITKRFGPVVALRGVDMELHRGEVLGIVGDNGTGKSTFVKILTGFYPPDSGQMFIEGNLVNLRSVSDARRHGIETVSVHPRPRVAVVSTGDELATASGTLAPGQIRDANRPALLAQLRVDGFQVVDLGTVGDDELALAHILEEGASSCDAVVATGGVSVGDRDVVRVVLEKLCGQAMRWMQVAVKPAKPFAFGTLASNQTPVFGLPGNPVSALVSYELFVRPALRAMAGYRVLDRPRLSATAETDLGRRRDGKLHLLRVLAQTGDDGTLRVRLSGGQDSHMLFAMAEANALALLPDGDGVAAGGRVDVLLLDTERLGPGGEEGPW